MSKQNSSTADIGTESLTDLPLTAEEAEGTKAGTNTAGTYTLTFNGQTTIPR